MRTTHILTVTLLASAALAAPAAAMPTDPPHGPGQPPVVVQAAPQSSGFDWGSAIIGAAGGVGAFAIALAATDGMRRRRLPRPGHVVPALMAVALVAPSPSMPSRDARTPVACHQMLPARVDAAAHADIMRAIGAAQMERNRG
jgi:hypothetical protein